jgi:hypothetical protein
MVIPFLSAYFAWAELAAEAEERYYAMLDQPDIAA